NRDQYHDVRSQQLENQVVIQQRLSKYLGKKRVLQRDGEGKQQDQSVYQVRIVCEQLEMPEIEISDDERNDGDEISGHIIGKLRPNERKSEKDAEHRGAKDGQFQAAIALAHPTGLRRWADERTCFGHTSLGLVPRAISAGNPYTNQAF